LAPREKIVETDSDIASSEESGEDEDIEEDIDSQESETSDEDPRRRRETKRDKSEEKKDFLELFPDDQKQPKLKNRVKR